jgi:hypothetical protein
MRWWMNMNTRAMASFQGTTRFPKILWLSMITLLICSLFSGCFEYEPERADRHLISLSSDMVQKSCIGAELFLYDQVVGHDGSFFINETSTFSYLEVYEQLQYSLLILMLATYNTSLWHIHEKDVSMLMDLIPSDNDSSVHLLDSLFISSLLLQILLQSPYHDMYTEQSHDLYTNIIGSYPYANLSDLETENDIIMYHLRMSHIAYSLLIQADKTGNMTAYSFAQRIIENSSQLLENISIEDVSLLCSSLYVPVYRVASLTFNDYQYDDIVFSLADKVTSFQNKDGVSVGAFPIFSQSLSILPDIVVDCILSETLLYAYEILHERDPLLNDKSSFLSSLILSMYHFNQMQLSSDDTIEFQGAFPLYNDTEIPSMLTTIYAYGFLHRFKELFNDSEPYVYVYDMTKDELYESHPVEVEMNDSIWVALFLGTILSILFIGIVYVYLVIKRRR